MEHKIWFITGASKGLGLTLAKKLLSSGYKVAATSRNSHDLEKALGIKSDTFLPLKTDLNDEASVAEAIEKTIQFFGRIDVVVNNAGYGIGGTLEELNAKEISDSIHVNLYGTIYVIQKVMPHLRRQRSGHILNISSIAGFAAGIGWPVYAAAKYAVMGLSESLAQDVKQFGIHVTAIAPGAFRTQFLAPGSIVFAENSISDYTEMKAGHQKLMSYKGEQLGDPEKAADAFISLVKEPDPPLILFLGSDAYQRASAKIDTLTRDLEKWKALSYSTDFE